VEGIIDFFLNILDTRRSYRYANYLRNYVQLSNQLLKVSPLCHLIIDHLLYKKMCWSFSELISCIGLVHRYNASYLHVLGINFHILGRQSHNVLFTITDNNNKKMFIWAFVDGMLGSKKRTISDNKNNLFVHNFTPVHVCNILHVICF